MKRILAIITIIVLTSSMLFSQDLNREYINNWILKAFPQIEIDSSTLYILNGYAFYSNNIDSVLVGKQVHDLTYIYFLDKNKPLEGIYGEPQNHIVLLRTDQLKRKLLKKDLKRIRRSFYPENNANTPVLLINDKQIVSGETYNILNMLKPSKIKGISIISIPVSHDNYGPNGINGLINIRLK